MWNNPIHVLAITEIRNNGGDDSLWLLHGDQKKSDSVFAAFNFLELGQNAENGGDNKKISGIWEWLKGAIWKHEAAMHSFIHSVQPVFVCGCSWRDWNLGHMESFLGMVPARWVMFWSCCDTVDHSRSTYLKIDKFEVGQREWGNGKRRGTVSK